MRIYVAGPYSASTRNDVAINVAIARAVATELWVLGHEAFCPHAASHDIDASKIKTRRKYVRDADKVLRQEWAEIHEWPQEKGGA